MTNVFQDEKFERQSIRNERKRKLVILDFETDPFEHGSHIEPFIWDIFDGKEHYTSTVWGSGCIKELVDYLQALPQRLMIYAHNGGKFDFMFLLKWIRGGDKMLIINNRIVEAELFHHTIRDSFAAIPTPLSAMEKDEIDYRKMHRDVRDLHKEEITRYLHKDTSGLFKYVQAYREEFGPNAKTMASAAIKELKKFHSYEIMNQTTDAKFREYYFGGRVECFKTGVIECPLKIYDVNSMYPGVMKNYKHPISAGAIPGDRIGRKTAFVEFEGESLGAVARRDEAGALRFPHAKGTFKTTIHEFLAGLETKTIKLKRVIKTYDFLQWITFEEFVEHFYSKRKIARDVEFNAVLALFYKLVMNSAYGKFAQNPTLFKSYYIVGEGEDGPEIKCWCPTFPLCKCGGWRLSIPMTPEGYELWTKPAADEDTFIPRGWHNVATAASITGAARSQLLYAICTADTPVYCDTDSLICRDLPESSHVKLDEIELGAWKTEKEGTKIAVAGKKMYAVWNGEKVVKVATKGVRLSADEIEAVSLGAVVEYHNQAPTLKFNGKQEYISRKVRKTA